MSEVALTPETVSRFRTRYVQNFGAARRDDALYAAVSESRRFAGMEHWLPLFYEKLGNASLTMCPARRWFTSIWSRKRLPSGAS